jgi:predicted nucleic acid-binding protein
LSALEGDTPDFEDTVQLYAALSAGADAIVTRDPKGFPTQAITILDPLAALAQL